MSEEGRNERRAPPSEALVQEMKFVLEMEREPVW